MPPKNLRLLLLVIPFLSLFTVKGIAQKNDMKINIGYGVLEGFHVGTDLRFSWYNIGVNVSPSNWLLPENPASLSIDNRFYFLRKESNAYENTFYANLKWHFLFENTEEYRATRYIGGISVGKDVDINPFLGVMVGVGVAFPVSTQINSRSEGFESISTIPDVIPELKACLYYRFGL